MKREDCSLMIFPFGYDVMKGTMTLQEVCELAARKGFGRVDVLGINESLKEVCRAAIDAAGVQIYCFIANLDFFQSREGLEADTRSLLATAKALDAQLRGENQMGEADVILPRAQEGCSWLLFAFYEQPSAQKTGNGRYYVIDHLSPAGAAACEAYWKSLFEAAGELPAMESIFCDSLEYNVALDWSLGFAGEFEKRRGYSILPYLPFIGYKGTYPESDAPGYRLDHVEISDMAGQDYLETVTQCHCEYHLGALESMAERFGKTIRCQVAYNKPFDDEHCPLYVAVPENEALGRPSMDGLKTMAAAAHQAAGQVARYYAVYGYNRIEYSPGEPNPEEIAVSSLYRKGSTKSTYERPGRGSRKEVTVSLDAAGEVFLLNPWSGQERPLPFTEREGRMEGTISIEEDEMILLAVRGDACMSGTAAMSENFDASSVSAGEASLGNGDGAAAAGAKPDPAPELSPVSSGAAAAGAEREIPVQFDALFLREFRPDSEGEKSFLRSSFSEEGRTIRLTDLRPWYELDPDLETFAGKGTYRGTLDIGPKEDGKRYVLCLGDVCDTFTVKINGADTVFPDQVMKEVEITDLVREGRNEIEVCVVSNLFNRLQKGLCIPWTEFPMPYRPKPYGIHEREGRNCCLRIL